MPRLAMRYHEGDLAPDDPVLAYAYLVALANTGLVKGLDPQLAEWAALLTPAQRDAAQRIAARFPR